jgi:hypothetical protein
MDIMSNVIILGIHTVDKTTLNININTTGVNGIYVSDTLSGTILVNAYTSTIIGIGTTFNTDFMIGDVITCNGESQSVVSITSDTIMIVSAPFKILNTWALTTGATIATTKFKFGTTSLTIGTTTTSRALLTSGSLFTTDLNTLGSWTIEFWLNLNAVTTNLNIMSSGVANTLIIGFLNSGDTLTLSLGRGTSMNIANATVVPGALLAATWYHIALVFTGSAYVLYKNGTAVLTITSSLTLTGNGFSSIILGGNGTTAANCAIDDFRLSKVSRYAVNFVPPTSAFIVDSDTLSLQHFENIQSDDTDTHLNYSRGGLVANKVYYVYRVRGVGEFISPRPDRNSFLLESGYDIGSVNKLPIFQITQNDFNTYKILNGMRYHKMFPHPLIISANASTTPVTNDLSSRLPIDTTCAVILLTHTHVGNILSGITIGTDTFDYITYLKTSVAGVSYMIIDAPLTNQLTFNSFVSATSSTTNYTLELVGFYTFQ